MWHDLDALVACGSLERKYQTPRRRSVSGRSPALAPYSVMWLAWGAGEGLKPLSGTRRACE